MVHDRIYIGTMGLESSAHRIQHLLNYSVTVQRMALSRMTQPESETHLRAQVLNRGRDTSCTTISKKTPTPPATLVLHSPDLHTTLSLLSPHPAQTAATWFSATPIQNPRATQPKTTDSPHPPPDPCSTPGPKRPKPSSSTAAPPPPPPPPPPQYQATPRPGSPP